MVGQKAKTAFLDLLFMALGSAVYAVEVNAFTAPNNIAAGGITMVDFWASWCGPCRMLSPTVDQVAEERPDVMVGKVNVDEQPELASQFQIMSIPTLIVIKNGEITNRSVGVSPKQQILSML